MTLSRRHFLELGALATFSAVGAAGLLAGDAIPAELAAKPLAGGGVAAGRSPVAKLGHRRALERTATGRRHPVDPAQPSLQPAPAAAGQKRGEKCDGKPETPRRLVAADVGLDRQPHPQRRASLRAHQRQHRHCGGLFRQTSRAAVHCGDFSQRQSLEIGGHSSPWRPGAVGARGAIGRRVLQAGVGGGSSGL